MITFNRILHSNNKREEQKNRKKGEKGIQRTFKFVKTICKCFMDILSRAQESNGNPCFALFVSFVAITIWVMFVWSCTAIEVGSIWIDVPFSQFFFYCLLFVFRITHCDRNWSASCQSPVKNSINISNNVCILCVCVYFDRLILYCHWIATCFGVRNFKMFSNRNRTFRLLLFFWWLRIWCLV